MRSQRVSVCMVDVERSWVLRKWQQAPIPSSFSKPIVFKSKPLDAFRRTKKPKGRNFGTRILDQCCLTHRQQFSIVCTLIDHRNDVKMFTTHVEPRAAGEWFHSPFFNILTSFLWSIWVQARVLLWLLVQAMENCCRFFFTLTVFVVHFRWLFAENRLWGREKQTAPPSFHFHSLWCYRQ